MKKIIGIFILLAYALISMQAIPAETELSCGTGTFGINISNNSPGTNAIYVYGPTDDNAYLDSYSGLSLGPFNAGGSYTIIMYANHQGEHTFTFSAPVYNEVEDEVVTFSESVTTASGTATFHPGHIVGNASASITYNGM